MKADATGHLPRSRAFPTAVEAMNKFENVVILEWHSITEPRAVATGSNHSTNLITSLMNQFSPGIRSLPLPVL